MSMIVMTMAALAATDAPKPDLSWLAGYWLSCEDGREVSETWSDKRGSTLFGIGLTISANGKLSWEMARIAPSAKGLSFFAQPSGQSPAEFPIKSSSANTVVFEDSAHDFPQRVSYRREGKRLFARIEGTIAGKEQSESWTYSASPLNARCPK